MKRVLGVALTVVLVGSVPVAAEAAQPSLKVTTVDRVGVGGTVLVFAQKLGTSREYRLRSGSAKKLPPGRYLVSTMIGVGSSEQTLGAKIVTLRSGRVDVRFDARKGRRIVLTPSIRDPRYYNGEVGVCVPGGAAGGGAAGGAGFLLDLPTYVIPVKDKKIRWSYQAQWANAVSGPIYATQGDFDSAKPTRNFTRTRFGKVALRVLKGKKVDPASNQFTAFPHSTSCVSGGLGFGRFTAPRTLNAYLSPGRWELHVDWAGDPQWSKTLKIVRGKTYRYTVRPRK